MKRLLFAALLASCASAVHAQGAYPAKPIRVIVGYTPGGATDIVARSIAIKLQEAFGQPVIVENKAGAGSNIASEFVVKSAPDGYTLLVGSIATATNMTAYRNLGFDTLRDLAPITQLVSSPSVLAVHPAFPARNLRELIALAKKDPGKYAFASSGSAGSPHLAGELLKLRAGIDLRGALAELLGGRVQVGFQTALSSMANFQSGLLRAIAIAAPRRLAQLPDVPTMAEAGLPDFEVSSWNGLFAPAKTPPAIIARLHETTAMALAAPDMRDRLLAQGAEPVGSTPEAFRAYIRTEIEKWGRVIREAGVRVE